MLYTVDRQLEIEKKKNFSLKVRGQKVKQIKNSVYNKSYVSGDRSFEGFLLKSILISL